jgi:putative FmdB family regulatory protein
MPTYEYECQKCSHQFELVQSMNDAPKKTCPKCKGRVKRLLGTGAGLIFKGSGFYITDYRNSAYKESAKKDTSTSASTSTTTPAPTKEAPKASTPAKKTGKD